MIELKATLKINLNQNFEIFKTLSKHITLVREIDQIIAENIHSLPQSPWEKCIFWLWDFRLGHMICFDVKVGGVWYLSLNGMVTGMVTWLPLASGILAFMTQQAWKLSYTLSLPWAEFLLGSYFSFSLGAWILIYRVDSVQFAMKNQTRLTHNWKQRCWLAYLTANPWAWNDVLIILFHWIQGSCYIALLWQ